MGILSYLNGPVDKIGHWQRRKAEESIKLAGPMLVEKGWLDLFQNSWGFAAHVATTC